MPLGGSLLVSNDNIVKLILWFRLLFCFKIKPKTEKCPVKFYCCLIQETFFNNYLFFIKINYFNKNCLETVHAYQHISKINMIKNNQKETIITT
jgi:hypothetical protein